MLKRVIAFGTLLLLPCTLSSEPLFKIGEASGRLAEACANLLRNETVQQAFASLGTAADARKASWPNLPTEPLQQAVQVAAEGVAAEDLVLLVDLHHCRQSVNSAGQMSKGCLGGRNLLNTGLPNYHPEDSDRDLVRWHEVSSFAGIGISYPQRNLDATTPGSTTQLQCRALEP